MSLPLLTTKFYIPPARENAISRPRLTNTLLSGMNQPGSFSLLSGPAGFGKTTLLSEFAARVRQPVAWLSLDEADNDPIRFWTYLITACQSVHDEIGESALALLRLSQPIPVEAVPSILINDLSGLDRDLVLILDDYHLIHNESIHTSLSFLLEHAPLNLHVVISTRIDPPFPLARFRARNLLVEVRTKDLRFTVDEAADFLNQIMGLNLTTEDVAALEERTEGWVAGLQLAAISMKGRTDIASFIKAFTGSNLYVAEYLVEEVLQRQPEDVQVFLLQTSLLERISAELCEAVTGYPNVQALLTSLQRTNLFILSLDDEGRWFRFHHLFADLLQSRLRQSFSADEIAALHKRAAAWFEKARMLPDAIDHYLAATDYTHTVRIIEKLALPMILQAFVRTVDDWLQAIPPEYLERSPKINMAYAWLHLLRAAFSQAAPYLDRLETFFSGSDAAAQDPSLYGEWLALQSKLLNMQGKPAESRDLANQALQILPERDAHVRSMLLVNLATAYQQLLEYDHAADTFRLIVRDAQAAGDFISEILGTSGQAQMLLQQGKLHLAFEIASEGIKRVEVSGRSTPFSATLYGELGQIYYHWHELDKAQEYLHRSIQSSGKSGYSDPEIYKHIMRSRIFQMEANWAAAEEEVQSALGIAQAMPPAMIREELISQQTRVYLFFNRLATAREVLRAEGFSFDESFTYPDLQPGTAITHPAGILYNSALRVLLFHARETHDPLNLKGGIDLAALVLAGELQCKHIPSAIETLLVRSQLYAALGDEQKSLLAVVNALELAEPEGFISIFVEEGLPISKALATLLDQNLLGKVAPDYVQEILSAFPASVAAVGREKEQKTSVQPNEKDLPAGDEPLVEPLTSRELEVLQLIALGDSNRAIAEKLFITVSAVKKHTGNIYGKLNVDSRTQAVARARQLGLISS